MHRTILSLAAAATIVATASLLPTRAVAMGAGTAAAIDIAVSDMNLVEDVRYVCRHRGWGSRRACWWRPVTVCRHRGWRSRRVCYRR